MKTTSYLEESLAFHLKALGLPEPQREFAFAAPERKFRSDFYYPPDLLIEVDGGVYGKSRHTSGSGFEKDAEKTNLAVLKGYRILRFGPKQVRSGEAAETIRRALQAKDLKEGSK